MSGKGVSAVIGGTQRVDIADYYVVEDSTPLDPSDTQGGFGQANITVRATDETIRYMGQPVELTDGSLGVTTGTVRGISNDEISATLVANSRIGNLAVERTILPFVGNLADAIEYYFSLCDITSDFVIHSSYFAIPVQLPGGIFNVYDRLKALGAAYGFEITLVSNNIVARPPHLNVAINYRDAGLTRSFDQSKFAQSIQGWAYNTTSGVNIAYPVHGLNDDAPVWQVDADQIIEYDEPIQASLSQVDQPTCVTSVSNTDMSASVYVVVDNEGDVVDPGLWVAKGGRLDVTIGEDTRSLIIRIKGAGMKERAPFRIGVSAGRNDYYSSLRIRGTGVFWDPTLMTIYTHDDADEAPDEVGVVVDNEFMETPEQLYHRLLRTAATYGTDNQRISVKSGGINRLGQTGSAVYPTIGDVNAMFPGATIGSIYSSLGPTIGDWNDALFAAVSTDFENQAFGNVAGARVLHKKSYYRIRTATIRPRDLDYEAERDNTVADVYRTGETIGQWNTRWAGKTIRDVNIAPLM